MFAIYLPLHPDFIFGDHRYTHVQGVRTDLYFRSFGHLVELLSQIMIVFLLFYLEMFNKIIF